jgi:extracellular elastinolytic metalloproteinase
MMRQLCILICLVFPAFLSVELSAQSRDALDIAKEYAAANLDKWNLLPGDIAGMSLSNRYQTRHNGVTHLYFLQRHAGIPVHAAVMGIHLASDGQVGFATQRFVSRLSDKVNAVQPTLSAPDAVRFAAIHLGLPAPLALRELRRPEPNHYVFEGGTLAQSDIVVKLVYQPIRPSGEVRLAWHIALDQTGTPDWWSMRVDALTGDLLEKNNWTVYCSFPGHEGHEHHSDDCADATPMLAPAAPLSNDGAQYLVFPLPLESPLHGDQQWVVNPADPIASPFGWHDTDGQSGPEHTITRGNNARAYLDPGNLNASSGGEPDGGSQLIFDFPYNPFLDAGELSQAATVNLFYLTNMMHDLYYHYGFDEEAGNFQENNYGNGGVGNDPVRSEAQDGGGINNANFATPPDGSPPRMQMYLWRNNTGNFLTVSAPESAAGLYNAGMALFGPVLSQTPLTADITLAIDNSSQPEFACQSIVNAAQVAGKIALIQRGDCTFKQKVRNAELAGAVAVIICNTDETLPTMGNTVIVPEAVNIPSIVVRNSVCQTIRVALDGGATVTASLQLPPNFDVNRIDGSFDNGIIAHEYGHGISNRLTGGPFETDCLFNNEQMGEGWSDFFTLITTAKPGDEGAVGRTIGNYARRTGLSGTGFRRFPYSTDFNVNAQTFDDIIGTTAPHPLGEVWTAMLWDLYWRFVDVYGWDEDLVHGNGGNNMAIQLVMDGMKLQACFPGFTDGRDAIIAADALNHDGIHECLIWEVFARRGLGWSADQGDNFDRNDGRQGFDSKPQCIKELKIAKTATPLIEAGDEIVIRITVTNHKENPANGVLVNDLFPANATFVNGSVSGATVLSQDGNSITFSLGNMAVEEEIVITYRMATAPNIKSVRQFYDDIESGAANWSTESLAGDAGWFISQGMAVSGTGAWFVPSTDFRNDQILVLNEPVTVSGANPILRFSHRYLTESGLDGGIVQISADGGQSWDAADALFFRNGYRGRIAQSTFGQAGVQAFWGSSQTFIGSYLDLSPYIGQDILVRFRFGTNAQSEFMPENGLGWLMDDFEIMDMYAYNSEACVTSNQGDQACAEAGGRGAIVQPGLVSSASEYEAGEIPVEVFPNPAGSEVNIAFTLAQSGTVHLQLLSTDGRSLRRQTVELGAGAHLLTFRLDGVPAGVYFLRLNGTVRRIVRR